MPLHCRAALAADEDNHRALPGVPVPSGAPHHGPRRRHGAVAIGRGARRGEVDHLWHSAGGEELLGGASAPDARSGGGAHQAIPTGAVGSVPGALRLLCRAAVSHSHLYRQAIRAGRLRGGRPSSRAPHTVPPAAQAGAIISEDLSGCSAILGIKEVPVEKIIGGKAYFCFSHTHKGQPHNMAMLKAFVDAQCTLVDYELLKDPTSARLVAFGKYAGYAGMVDCLHGLGVELLERGYRTPLLVCPLPVVAIQSPPWCCRYF